MQNCMTTHIFNFSTQKAEADSPLCGQGQKDLHIELSSWPARVIHHETLWRNKETKGQSETKPKLPKSIELKDYANTRQYERLMKNTIPRNKARFLGRQIYMP